ncbi:MAG TPA: crosslink repair DNA glycosylase YcaQ family protein [Holophaga sp.]|nr:crosslink repair DNA glycosylase YcaQ family protein [Holophaga sp.]
MPAAPQPVTTAQARRLLLAAQALLGPPARDAGELVERLGFVQMDSINVVERAHHLTLGSRLPGYRRTDFEALLAGERRLFEHWTHDASAIPLAHYPHWKHRFPRSRARLLASAWWRERVGDQVEALLDSVRARIRAEGPLMSADFEHAGPKGPSAWWGWKPAKAALEFLWHTGELAVAGRVNFHKVYDLPERVFPDHHRRPAPSRKAHVEWACSTAMTRLGVATPRELAAFWEAVSPEDAALWCAAAVRAGRAVPVEVGEDPPRAAYALPDWPERARELEDPGDRMVLLCPFDPILRDRARAQRLFGFDYRFEAFTPQAKRQFGYYVLPILEGERLVGRLDPKFRRDEGVLEVQGLWWEPGVKPGKARLKKLGGALEDLAARIGAASIRF